MLNQLKYSSVSVPTDSYSVIKLTGNDVQDYLHRQLTNDIRVLKNHEGQLSCRLDRTGKLHSFFYIGLIDTSYWILCERSLKDKIIEELDKFVIMEDVSIEEVDCRPILVAGPLATAKGSKSFFETSWCDQKAFFIFDELSLDNIEKSIDIKTHILKSAWPVTGLTLAGSELVNETRLNELAVDYNKGCFLGQETAAKIQSRRGAAKYPALVELLEGNSFEHPSFKNIWGEFSENQQKYALIQLPREERVNGKILESGENKYRVISIDNTQISNHEIAEELFLKAVELFQQKEDSRALELLDRAILIDPTYADAYESKGAILGQMDKFKEAIDVMDQLLAVDEHSVMAHTNKSLFFMKIGEIEKAEEEKSLATVANFQKLGAEAKIKKQLAAEEEKKLAEMKRRESMFLQVIEMDDKDAIANYGMADIYYFRKEYSKSYEHLKVVLSENEKYSTAYALLGKVCEELGRIAEAKDIYEKGISVASNQGDMMPANEMQSRLNQLRSVN
jgi:folate-binding protein YgfZ